MSRIVTTITALCQVAVTHRHNCLDWPTFRIGRITYCKRHWVGYVPKMDLTAESDRNAELFQTGSKRVHTGWRRPPGVGLAG